jgi:hypothetical protein
MIKAGDNFMTAKVCANHDELVHWARLWSRIHSQNACVYVRPARKSIMLYLYGSRPLKGDIVPVEVWLERLCPKSS